MFHPYNCFKPLSYSQITSSSFTHTCLEVLSFYDVALQLPQILDQVAVHFFLKINAFSGWTNGKRNVICDALVFLPMVRCRIFHQHIIHGEGPVAMTQNPLAFLNFTAGNCVLCYQDHPFPFFWPSVLLSLLMYIFSLTLH